MQCRQRNCSVIYILFLMVTLFLLLLLDKLYPPVTELLQFTHLPVLNKGGDHHTTTVKLNRNGQMSLLMPAIIPRTTVADMSSTVKEVVPATPREQKFVNTLEGEHSRNITPGPYPYTINEPDKCTKSTHEPFLVLLITTEARQVEARNVIRQTWGNESVAPALGFIRLFLLGGTYGELGLEQQKMLEAESLRHHDIIQQDFRDTYNNLTIKTLMGLNWVALHCPKASYVMKTDSDMIVNTEYLIYKLLQPEIKPKMNYFTGYVFKDLEPIRNNKSKWYMPPELYPGDRYPTFCSGTGYVLSGDLVTKIYRASLSIPLIHLEDVYVGFCLAKLGIEPTPPSNAFLFNNWRVSYSSCKYSHLITSHGFHPNEILKYWHRLQSTKHNACINMMKARAGRTHGNKPNKERKAH